MLYQNTETVYCNIMESLEKNYKVRGFITSTVTQRTDTIRTVKSILDVMADIYSCTIGKKTLRAMRDITIFNREGSIDNLICRYDRMIPDVKEIDLEQILMYRLILHFVEMM